MDQINPFVIGSDIPVEFFCDREVEVELLHKHIANGRNVVLSSPRRLGKSGLIHHFFKQPKIKKKYNTYFVDIYATKSFEEFIYELSKAVQNKFLSKKNGTTVFLKYSKLYGLHLSWILIPESLLSSLS